MEARKANALLARLERGPAERCREDALVHYLAGARSARGRRAERRAGLAPRRARRGALRRCGRADRGPRGGRRPRAGGARRGAAPRWPTRRPGATRWSHRRRPPRRGRRAGAPAWSTASWRTAPSGAARAHLPGGDGGARRATTARRWPRRPRASAARLLHDAWERAALGRACGRRARRCSWPARSRARTSSASPGRSSRREASRPVARARLGRRLARRAWCRLGDLSAVVQREMEAERPAMLARLVARGLAKYLVSREMERKAEERGRRARGLPGGPPHEPGRQRAGAGRHPELVAAARPVSLVRARLPAGRAHGPDRDADGRTGRCSPRGSLRRWRWGRGSSRSSASGSGGGRAERIGRTSSAERPTGRLSAAEPRARTAPPTAVVGGALVRAGGSRRELHPAPGREEPRPSGSAPAGSRGSPRSSRRAPPWCSRPDATGSSRSRWTSRSAMIRSLWAGPGGPQRVDEVRARDYLSTPGARCPVGTAWKRAAARGELPQERRRARSARRSGGEAPPSRGRPASRAGPAGRRGRAGRRARAGSRGPPARRRPLAAASSDGWLLPHPGRLVDESRRRR